MVRHRLARVPYVGVPHRGVVQARLERLDQAQRQPQVDWVHEG